MVHENFRWQSPIQAVQGRARPRRRSARRSGAASRFRSGYDVFSGQPYLATGKRFIIEDLGIHILDIARFLLGDVDDAHRAHAARQPDDRRRGRRDDAARPRKAARPSVVDCSYATRLPSEPFPETLVEIDGSEGTIRLAQGYRLTVTSGGETTRHATCRRRCYPGRRGPGTTSRRASSAIQQHWVDCLQGRTRAGDLGRRQSEDLRAGRGGLSRRRKPPAGGAGGRLIAAHLP